eukprot:821163-Rhodomonas_salina.1
MTKSPTRRSESPTRRSESPMRASRSRSPDSMSGGSVSPVSVRTSQRGPAKLRHSSDMDLVPRTNEFEFGKVVMPLDKAVKVVVDVNAEIKVLEKMDTRQLDGAREERTLRLQANKAEQLVQKLNSIYVLDIVERRRFEPLYERVMAELVPFLSASTTIEKAPGSSKARGGRRNSLVRAAEKQKELLDKVAGKLAAIEGDQDRPAIDRQLTQTSSVCSWDAGDSAERDDTDEKVKSIPEPITEGLQRKAGYVTTSCFGNSTSSLGGSLSESCAADTVLPRNMSASSLLDVASVSESTEPLRLLPRNNSADSLFDLASVGGSFALPVLPRNNSADSLFDLGSVSGSSAVSCELPRSSSNNSLLEGLLEHQTGRGAPQERDSGSVLARNSSAVSLFNELTGEGSSIGIDSDAGSDSGWGRSRPVSESTSSASLFDALLAVQHPGSSSGSVMPRSTSMPSTYSFFSTSTRKLSGMQIPEQDAVAA